MIAWLLTGCAWFATPDAPTCPDHWTTDADGCHAALDGVATVTVPPGTFLLGCEPDAVSFCPNKPLPRTRVTLTRGTVMMVHEVTQAQYAALTGTNPSRMADCDTCPVHNVDWYDAVRTANLLSLHDGLDPAYVIDGTTVSWTQASNGWRLPTEAEWEWAAKGDDGFAYAGSDDATEVAWWEGANEGRPSPVGTKAANGFGLHDMSGNVWEWVWDHPAPPTATEATDPTGAPKPILDEPTPDSKGDERIVKGGAWADFPHGLHPGYRGFVPATHKGVSLGFRLVRTASD